MSQHSVSVCLKVSSKLSYPAKDKASLNEDEGHSVESRIRFNPRQSVNLYKTTIMFSNHAFLFVSLVKLSNAAAKAPLRALASGRARTR